MDFSSVHNALEKDVFAAITQAAVNYPDLEDDWDLLADVACVALNRLPARYIRHSIDFAFYRTEQDWQADCHRIDEAVEYAFTFVLERRAMGSR